MKRYLLHTAAVGSLLLCLLSIGLWVLSHWRWDSLVLKAGSAMLHLQTTRPGKLDVIWDWPGNDPGESRLVTGYAWTPPGTNRFDRPAGSLLGVGWGGAAVPGSVGAHGWARVPLWLAALLTAGVFVVTLRAVWRLERRRRQRDSVCTDCRYDLRGSESRACPECGAHREATT